MTCTQEELEEYKRLRYGTDPIESFNIFIRLHVPEDLHAHFADSDDNDAEFVRRCIRQLEQQHSREIAEARKQTTNEIRALFDISECRIEGMIGFDEDFISRTPEEIQEAKRYNFDHSWAAMSAQGKIDDYIALHQSKQQPPLDRDQAS